MFGWQGPFHGIGFTSGTGPCYFFSWLKLSLNVGRKTYWKLVFAISSSEGSSPLLVFMLYLSAPKTNIGSILAAPSEEKSLHRSSPKPTETNFLSARKCLANPFSSPEATRPVGCNVKPKGITFSGATYWLSSAFCLSSFPISFAVQN